jgi:hypothetical protein
MPRTEWTSQWIPASAPEGPTSRWWPMPRHLGVQGYLRSTKRFNIVPAGRRSYKTEAAKRRLVKKALREVIVPGARYIACAPTREQAKDIFWDHLNALIPPELVAKRRDSNLSIRLINGNGIFVVGMDRPQRVEGKDPIAYALLDEFGDMKPEAFTNHVGPALTDLEADADFIGVPEGRNHYYDMFVEAQADQSGLWGWHHWTSEEILPEREISYWKARLDPITYAQEFLASFVSYLGRAYYQFERGEHIADHLPYDPNAPLIFCFDFNQTPGVACVGQEAHHLDRTLFLSEVYIERNSKTPMVCRALLDGATRKGIQTCPGYRNHPGLVYLYGDATGGAGGSAKVEGSDWDLVKKVLRPVFGDRLVDRVPEANPRERVRVNSVNSRFRAQDETIRALVDSRCLALAKDLEGVSTVEGGSGDIDKQKHRTDGLTHISDAAGYYIVAKFPTRGQGAFGREEF